MAPIMPPIAPVTPPGQWVWQSKNAKPPAAAAPALRVKHRFHGFTGQTSCTRLKQRIQHVFEKCLKTQKVKTQIAQFCHLNLLQLLQSWTSAPEIKAVSKHVRLQWVFVQLLVFLFFDFVILLQLAVVLRCCVFLSFQSSSTVSSFVSSISPAVRLTDHHGLCGSWRWAAWELWELARRFFLQWQWLPLPVISCSRSFVCYDFAIILCVLCW